MKRAAIISVVFAVLGFLGGLIFVKITSDVVPTMVEYRKHGPNREQQHPVYQQHPVRRAPLGSR